MTANPVDPADSPVRPPALGAGARVALVSPAGPSPAGRLERAIERCHALGFEPVPARHVADRSHYLAGSDASRLEDLAGALRDPTIDAVWAVRGGYGSMRLLARLDASLLRERPRAFIGFSDNTALHQAFAKAGLVSFHGPHPGAPFPEFTEQCFRDMLFRAEPAGELPLPADGEPLVCLRDGEVEGRLAGGNLAVLASLCGTPWALNARGCIVLIEDVNEPAYRIDRAFTQLRLAGCLDGAVAIAFGRLNWTEPVPASEPPRDEVLAALVRPLDLPAAAGLPFGHVDEQWCLPLGARARLDAGSGTLVLLESAVQRGSR